jgi:hypothetical protein
MPDGPPDVGDAGGVAAADEAAVLGDGAMDGEAPEPEQAPATTSTSTNTSERTIT